MSHSGFIHSSTDQHLGCFHIVKNATMNIGVIINNAAMNIGVLTFWVPSDTFPEVGSLGQKAYPFLIF